jgi:hypothetical protein
MTSYAITINTGTPTGAYSITGQTLTVLNNFSCSGITSNDQGSNTIVFTKADTIIVNGNIEIKGDIIIEGMEGVVQVNGNVKVTNPGNGRFITNYATLIVTGSISLAGGGTINNYGTIVCSTVSPTPSPNPAATLNLNGATVHFTGGSTAVYSGTPITPTVEYITVNTVDYYPANANDFVYIYTPGSSDGTSIGTISVQVRALTGLLANNTGSPEYAYGTTAASTFTIAPYELNSGDFQLSPDNVVYNGTAQPPTYSFPGLTLTFTLGTDYDVEVYENDASGTKLGDQSYLATITDVNNYFIKIIPKGNFTASGVIGQTYSITQATLAYQNHLPTGGNYVYNGQPQNLLDTLGSNVPAPWIMQFSLDQNTWSSDIPQQTNAGATTVYIRWIVLKSGNPDPNYKIAYDDGTCTIKAAPVTVNWPTPSSICI